MLGHVGPKPHYPRFQIILEHNDLQRVTDVPLTGLDVARLGPGRGGLNQDDPAPGFCECCRPLGGATAVLIR